METLHHPPPNPRPRWAGELSKEVIFGAKRRKSPLYILLRMKLCRSVKPKQLSHLVFGQVCQPVHD